jgi:hypothetical protein
VGGPALGAVSVLSITIPLFGSLAGDLPGERWTPQTASVFWTTLVWGFFSLTIGGFFDPTALARARSPERYVQQVRDGLPALEGWF